ncbi:MAG TPA: hypothetical protein ENH55_16750 [Aurantimonas coralicida]|uniref:Uncharacterized protein n=2 Tax=root TaxID=1 RepID=A0A9C9TI94_9HYPH|nr:hypothetical protein [Aurantimonas coralicida]HEU02132.1 hypothetical protein [Aurantimonas coralicida]
MTIDFAGLLDAPAYEIFGVEAVLTPVGRLPLTLDVLNHIVEVEEAGDSGVVVPTVRPAVDLQLADLAPAGFGREDLVKAEVTFGGVRYRVLATAPTSNARELRLILIEDA